MSVDPPLVVFLTRDRGPLLRLTLPAVRRACAEAGARLLVVDDGSRDPLARRLLAESGADLVVNDPPLTMHGPRAGLWGPRWRAAWIARQQFGADELLRVDGDVLLGPRAVTDLAEAAADAPGEWAGLYCLGRRRATLDGPCADALVIGPGRWSYVRRWHDLETGRRRGMFHDSLEFLRLWRVDYSDVPGRLLRYGLGLGRQLGVYSPQIEAQHLGFGEHGIDRGTWGADAPLSAYQRGPCVSMETGEPLGVRGLDLELWRLLVRSRPDLLARYCAGERAPVYQDSEIWRDLPARIFDYRGPSDDAELARLRAEGRRLLVRYHGRWQGDRTRAALGVSPRDPRTRVCPAGHDHPWLGSRYRRRWVESRPAGGGYRTTGYGLPAEPAG
jgi:hypothetical protein